MVMFQVMHGVVVQPCVFVVILLNKNNSCNLGAHMTFTEQLIPLSRFRRNLNSIMKRSTADQIIYKVTCNNTIKFVFVPMDHYNNLIQITENFKNGKV